ncbi:queuosine salvage family protein [Patescibacteria group bacterium]
MNPWYEKVVGYFENRKNRTGVYQLPSPRSFYEDDEFVAVGHVKIKKQKLEERAKQWAEEDFEIPEWREPVQYPHDDDDFIQWLGIVTAINAYHKEPGIGSIKFYTNWKDKKWTGAFGVSACVTRAIIEKKIPLLDPYFLHGIKISQMREIFNVDSNLPLLEKRMQIWKNIARVLISKYNGQFANLFKEANYRCFDGGNGICERLVEDFPGAYYDKRSLDRTRYDNWLPFHKKALLFLLEYYGRAQSSDTLPQIKDVESLSVVADCVLPKILYILEIFKYSPFLRNKISMGEEIEENFPLEIQIRLATVLAIGKLLEAINQERKKLNLSETNMARLYYKLWGAGRNYDGLYHITETLDY